MTNIFISLSGEPKGKGRPRFGNGRAFTPAATKSYEGVLRLEAQNVMGTRPPLEGPLSIVVSMFMPIPKSWSKRKRADALSGVLRPIVKPDWDNGAKMTDALNEVVWRDDSQVVDGRVIKRYSDRPRLEISIREVDVEWWKGTASDPSMHDKDCGFHLDQYRRECTCGMSLLERVAG